MQPSWCEQSAGAAGRSTGLLPTRCHILLHVCFPVMRAAWASSSAAAWCALPGVRGLQCWRVGACGNAHAGQVHGAVWTLAKPVRHTHRLVSWGCRHVRHDVRRAGRRRGADDDDRDGCRVLHRLQGLDAVQHLELLLLQPRLRQQPQGHLRAEEPDQPFLPQVLLGPAAHPVSPADMQRRMLTATRQGRLSSVSRPRSNSWSAG